jgi:hypothetical protein
MGWPTIVTAFGDRISLAPDTVAKFHWPGDESTALGTTVGYPFDINHARDAASRLATYLAALPVTGNGASRRFSARYRKRYFRSPVTIPTSSASSGKSNSKS